MRGCLGRGGPTRARWMACAGRDAWSRRPMTPLPRWPLTSARHLAYSSSIRYFGTTALLSVLVPRKPHGQARGSSLVPRKIPGTVGVVGDQIPGGDQLSHGLDVVII